MVAPLALMAGGTALSAILGARAASQQNATQAQIAQAQLNASARDTAQRNAMSQRLLRIQLEGGTDERGTRTQYVPGLGTVVTPTDVRGSLIAAQDREALLQAVLDTATARRAASGQEDQRQQASALSAALLQRLARPRELDAGTLAAVDNLRARQPVNDAYNATQQAAARQMLRSGSGNSNAGRLFSQLARQRSSDLAQTRTASPTTATQSVDAARQNQLGSMYTMLANRAAGYATPQLQQVTPASAGGINQALTGLGQTLVYGSGVNVPSGVEAPAANNTSALLPATLGNLLSEYMTQTQKGQSGGGASWRDKYDVGGGFNG